MIHFLGISWPWVVIKLQQYVKVKQPPHQVSVFVSPRLSGSIYGVF
ncbi:hypothetical protein VCRA2114E327_40082 [Vibrio crassostreae]|nr:hypothetical protein VCRA2114E327_40082 [Vibrio crassostreae]